MAKSIYANSPPAASTRNNTRHSHEGDGRCLKKQAKPEPSNALSRCNHSYLKKSLILLIGIGEMLFLAMVLGINLGDHDISETGESGKEDFLKLFSFDELPAIKIFGSMILYKEKKIVRWPILLVFYGCCTFLLVVPQFKYKNKSQVPEVVGWSFK